MRSSTARETDDNHNAGGETSGPKVDSDLVRLSEALEEADALRVSVRSRDAALQAQVSIQHGVLNKNLLFWARLKTSPYSLTRHRRFLYVIYRN